MPSVLDFPQSDPLHKSGIKPSEAGIYFERVCMESVWKSAIIWRLRTSVQGQNIS